MKINNPIWEDGRIWFQLGVLFVSYSKAGYIPTFPLLPWVQRCYENRRLSREEMESMLDDASEFFHRADIQNPYVNREAQKLVGRIMECLSH